MDFLEEKEMVQAQIKNEYGMLRNLAENANTNYQMVWRTFKVCCLADMTTKQREVYKVALEMVAKKQAEFGRIERKTAKLAEKTLVQS
jgi:hypothetical protein